MVPRQYALHVPVDPSVTPLAGCTHKEPKDLIWTLWSFRKDRRVRRSHTLDLAGISVGTCHGLDHPRSSEYWDRAMKREFGGRVDVVVVGDTHVAMVERLNGFCPMNPGSPALPNNRYELGPVGLLEIAGRRVEARIVQPGDFPLPFHRDLFYY